jgi:hypothetical protein
VKSPEKDVCHACLVGVGDSSCEICLMLAIALLQQVLSHFSTHARTEEEVK